MFGGTNDNLDEIKKIDPTEVAGIKLFLGSSTGKMLIDNLNSIEKIFSSTSLPISAHCEDEQTIRNNSKKYKEIYGEDVPMEFHPKIRSEEACYKSSKYAVDLAKKTGSKVITADATKMEDLNQLIDKAQEILEGKIDFVLHSIGMSVNVRKGKHYTNLNHDWMTKGWDVSAVSFHKLMQCLYQKNAMNESNFNMICSQK